MKKATKMLAYMLILTFIFNLSVPPFAAKAAEKTYGYISADETILATSDDFHQNARASAPEIVVTYIEDEERNHQIFTYRDGELVEIVYGGINAKVIRTQTIEDGKVVSESTMNVEVYEQVAPSLYAYKKQGVIEYESSWIGETLGITLYLDTYSIVKNATIKTGVYSLGQLASWLYSAWQLPSLGGATTIVKIIWGNVFLAGATEIFGTKTVTGTVSEYTWRGDPSDTTRGDTAYLDGVKVDYKDKNGNAKTYTEGYQANAFSSRNLTFGRWMMYSVYDIDEHPTTWR